MRKYGELQLVHFLIPYFSFLISYFYSAQLIV